MTELTEEEKLLIETTELKQKLRKTEEISWGVTMQLILAMSSMNDAINLMINFTGADKLIKGARELGKSAVEVEAIAKCSFIQLAEDCLPPEEIESLKRNVMPDFNPLNNKTIKTKSQETLDSLRRAWDNLCEEYERSDDIGSAKNRIDKMIDEVLTKYFNSITATINMNIEQISMDDLPPAVKETLEGIVRVMAESQEKEDDDEPTKH